MTAKENFLRLMRNDSPEWLGDPWDCFWGDPLTVDGVTIAMAYPRPGQMNVKNAWGATFDFPEGQPGFVPNVTEENCVIKDITCWRDYVQFPDISKMQFPKVESDGTRLVMCPSFAGPFEFTHYMMPFEEALMNFLLEPEAMEELISASMDWKIQAAERLIDEMHPDVIHTQDDWGSKQSMFLSPETWRSIIKPHYARFCAYLKSRGVLIQHHCDGVADAVAGDMVEMGIDMWQGVLPENDVEAVLRRTEGRLCLMGLLDMPAIDQPDVPEETIRAAVRSAVERYMPLGHVIICPTNITAITPSVQEIIHDELNSYGAAYAKAHF